MVYKRYNRKVEPKVRTSVEISPEFYDLAKEHQIQFSEAIRVGISIMLAEKGVSEYDNQLNIKRLLDSTILKAGNYAKKAFDLEQELEVMRKNANK